MQIRETSGGFYDWKDHVPVQPQNNSDAIFAKLDTVSHAPILKLQVSL